MEFLQIYFEKYIGTSRHDYDHCDKNCLVNKGFICIQ